MIYCGYFHQSILPIDIIGGIYPATYLKIKRLIFLSNHDTVKTLDSLNPKLIILENVSIQILLI